MSTALTPGAMKAASELFPHRHQMMLDEYATIIDRIAVDPALAQLRARVAELEEKAERYRLTTLRQDATIAELTTDGNAATLAANLAAVSKRNAELVAALRDAVGMLEELDGLDWGEEGMPFAVDFDHFAKLLARAESATPDHIPDAAKMVSATPAKHPDTERLDWLEAAPSERLAEVRRVLWQQHNTCMATRAAIDAARKQGGAE